METVRAFVALSLDDASRARVAAIADRLKGCCPPRIAPAWIAPAKMHLTIKFLGSIDAALVPALGDALRPLTVGAPAPRATITRVHAFSSPARAHVVTIELDDPARAMARIAADVEKGCEALGFAREARPFRAHVTLARLRDRTDVRAWLERARDVAADEVVFPELALMRSETKPTGSEYTPLARALFSAA